jgi:hypothetical protein
MRRELAEQLRREALADRPTFSNGLQERVRAGIARSQARPAAQRPWPSRSTRWLGVAVASAAALLVSAVASRPPQRAPGDANEPTLVESDALAVERLPMFDEIDEEIRARAAMLVVSVVGVSEWSEAMSEATMGSAALEESGGGRRP